MSKKLIISLLKTVVPLLLGTYLIWYSFSSMSKEQEIEFYKAIKEANYLWIFIAVVLSFIAFISRAYRWKFALEPLGLETKFWNRYHAIMIGYIMNLTIPRAGEASRAAMLYRSDGVSFTTSFGTIIAERAVDFLILLFIGAVGAYLAYDDFVLIMNKIKSSSFGDGSSQEGFPWKYVIFGFVGAVCGILLVLFIKKSDFRTKMIGFARDVFAGLFSIFRLKQPFAYIGHTLLIWSCYLLMFGLPFFSLEQTSHFTLAGIFMGFIAGSLGVIFTNGGIGSYPVLIGLVVAFYIGDKYTYETALAIGTALGWIIWLSQTLLLIILGLISLVLLPKNYTPENVATKLHTEQNSNEI